MKLIIVLKQHDADGFGGELLTSLGMLRSPVDPGVFSLSTAVHDTARGYGDTSWSQPEATTQLFLEALMDAGVRPVRWFHQNDRTAVLTQLRASVDEKAQLVKDKAAKLAKRRKV